MPYRDDETALRARIAVLERALDRVAASRPRPWRRAVASALLGSVLGHLVARAETSSTALGDRHAAFVRMEITAHARSENLRVGDRCSLFVTFAQASIAPCTAQLDCFGEARDTGPVVCGASPRGTLEWIAPSPASDLSLVLERDAGVVFSRARADGEELETRITSFSDLEMP